MTGDGWSYAILGGWSMAWFGLVIIVFLAMIARRQCEDGILAGTGFNIIGAFVGGVGAYVVLISITGSARWALISGLLGIAIGGWVIGQFFDTTGGGDE